MKHKTMKNKDKENSFIIYVDAHKKYKYWFAIYFFLLIAVFLLYSKYEYWDILDEYLHLDRNLEYFEFITSFKKAPDSLLLENIINENITFNPKTIPWSNRKMK